MGERKVLNKYFPPDFDPSKIPRKRRGEDEKQIKVRMMLPFSMRCVTCGNYIYKGTKFNSRKEDVPSDTYLGIRVFRFYLRCPRCAGEITVKTDPKNSDYVCELGATRNFEPHREQQRQEEDVKRKREEEEEGDAMRALENRTMDNKREMDILSALDEMKTKNARNAKFNTDQVIAALRRSAGDNSEEFDMEDEDEHALQQFILRDKSKVIKRIREDEEKPSSFSASQTLGSSKSNKNNSKVSSEKKSAVKFAVRPAAKPQFVKKAKIEEPKQEDKPKESQSSPLGLGGLVAYTSSDDSA